VRLGPLSASLAVDDLGGTWLEHSDDAAPRALADSPLRIFRLGDRLWLAGGTPADLPAWVRLEALSGAGARVAFAAGAAGWVALVEADPIVRLAAEWSNDARGRLEPARLQPLEDVATDAAPTPYGPPARPGR
jgi:hypothetical protein